MTTDMELGATMAALTEELAGKYGADAQRDPSIPAGTVLSQTESEAGYQREVKQNSMVRLGKTPLPARFEAWDVYGRSSDLPTAQMSYMLSKQNAERPGVRAFHVHRGEVNRQTCTICPPTRELFKGTCSFCFERTGGTVTKSFETEDARDGHYRAFHGEQYMALERRLDRELQRESLEMQRQQAANTTALLERVLGTPVADPVAADALRQERLNDGAGETELTVPRFPCDQCEKTFTASAHLASHQRVHAPKE